MLAASLQQHHYQVKEDFEKKYPDPLEENEQQWVTYFEKVGETAAN